MFSSQFLSSYYFFSSAVWTFRDIGQADSSTSGNKAVVDAFKKATSSMSKQDRATFIEYMQWLSAEPARFERERRERDIAELEADDRVAKSGGQLIDKGRIISAIDFLARTGMTEDVLALKVSERRIFKIPDWVDVVWSEEYYPAFFADSQYDLGMLETISQALRDADGVRKYRFFTSPDLELDGKAPLDILAEGNLERVLLAAKGFRKLTRRASSINMGR
ncbi:hypothetical protein V8G57_07440 [Collimonas sp. H4R21]|uniref:Antitoxin Xre/MbcA/ParS-like toxin-binding domain-containing protein n=1 Tax=Collimonas rhizosphaerae TaxID=3126357 RepID=A0ABU9PTB0_9BURK